MSTKDSESGVENQFHPSIVEASDSPTSTNDNENRESTQTTDNDQWPPPSSPNGVAPRTSYRGSHGIMEQKLKMASPRKIRREGRRSSANTTPSVSPAIVTATSAISLSSTGSRITKTGMRDQKAAYFSDASQNPANGDLGQNASAREARVVSRIKQRMKRKEAQAGGSNISDELANPTVDSTVAPTTDLDKASFSVPGAYHVEGDVSDTGSAYLPETASGDFRAHKDESEDIIILQEPAGLNTARIVSEDEVNNNGLDDIERAKVFERAQKEAEDRLKATTVTATEELTDKQKRKRRLLCGCGMLLLFGAIVGAVTGGLVAGLDGNSNSAPSSIVEQSTPAPTPFVPFEAELDICEGALDITDRIGQVIKGSTVGASVNQYDTCGPIERNGRGVFYRIVGDGKTKFASTCNNTYFDTQISVFSGKCGLLQCVSGNDQIRCGNGDQSTLAWHAEMGEEYVVHVHGVRSSKGVFELKVDNMENNDECIDATEVTFNSSTPIFGSTRNATMDFAQTCGTANQVSGGVWYIVAGVDGEMIANAETERLTLFSPQISVYEGSGCGELACVAGDVSEVVSWTGESDKQYYILVHGRGAIEGDFIFRVVPEIIVVEPPQDDDALLTCDMAGHIPAGGMGQGNTFFGPVSDAQSCGRDVFSGSQSKWFTTTGTGGAMVASTCDTTSGFDTQVSVYAGDSCASLRCVDGNDQSCGDQSSVVWYSSIGTTYFILVQGTPGRTGEFNLTVDDEMTFGEPLVVTSPTCDGAVSAPVNGASVLGSFADAAVSEVGECAPGVVGGDEGVWYEVVGSGQAMTVSTCDGFESFGLRLLVFVGGCESLRCVSSVSTPCGSRESVIWSSVEGERYSIFVQRTASQDISRHLQSIDGADRFVLYAGETAPNSRCQKSIGPITPDNSLTFGTIWTASSFDAPGIEIDSDLPERGVWYTVLGTGGILLANACSELTSFEAQVSVYVGSCGATSELSLVENQITSKCQNGEGIVRWNSDLDQLYYLLVSGVNSVATSNFALAISTENDTCYGAQMVELDGKPIAGSTIGATIDGAMLAPTCLTQGPQVPNSPLAGVWYEIKGSGEFIAARVSANETSSNPQIALYRGAGCRNISCEQPATYMTNEKQHDNQNITWKSEANQNYKIFVYGEAKGRFTLYVETVKPTNDVCTGATFAPLVPGSVPTSGTTVGATVEEVESIPFCPIFVEGDEGDEIDDTSRIGRQPDPTESSPGVWYTVVGTGSIMTASTCGTSDFDSRVTVFDSDGSCNELLCVEGSIYSFCRGRDSNPGMQVSWFSVAGVSYSLLVYGSIEGSTGSVGNFGLSVSSFALPPT